MARPETLCPSCGSSPVPEGSERCPWCGKAFSYDRVDSTNVTATRAGGLTGSVTATPAPTAIALAAGAFLFTVRAGGFLADVGDSPLVFAVAALDVVALVLVDEVSGFRLTLPPGWRPATEEEVAPHLVLPWDGGKTVNRGFRLESPRQVGVLIVSRDEQPELQRSCRDMLAKLGVTRPLDQVDGSPPPSLGEGVSLFELKTKSGAAGRFGCALVGTKLVGLAVVSQDPTPGVGAAAFEWVAGGLAVQP